MIPAGSNTFPRIPKRRSVSPLDFSINGSFSLSKKIKVEETVSSDQISSSTLATGFFGEAATIPKNTIKSDSKACFGMIQTHTRVPTRDEVNDPDAMIKYQLQKIGGLTTVHYSQSADYIVLLDNQTAVALDHLKEKFSVTLECFSPEKRVSEGTSGSSPSDKKRQLFVVIYGLSQENKQVGDLLSKNGIFLQHPIWYDDRIPYENPQYLFGPETKLEISSYECSGNFLTPVPKNKNFLSLAKVQSLKIFDTACGPTILYSDINISKRLKTKLLSHQKKGLAMMIEKENGVLEGNTFKAMWQLEDLGNGVQRYRNVVTGQIQFQLPEKCLGGLLADDMGLGKTLTILALIARSVDISESSNLNLHNSINEDGGASVTTLLVCPLSTISNWEDQIAIHFKPRSLKVLVYHGARQKKKCPEFASYDLIITTYAKVAAEYISQTKSITSKPELLISYNWFRIVLDEAHVIKDRSTQQHAAVCSLKAQHRWCITGTPIQNRVEDFGALLRFLRVYPFQDPASFASLIANPVENGYESGFHKLRLLINATMLRRTKDSLSSELQLKGRIDKCHMVDFTTEEKELYDFFKNPYVASDEVSAAYGISNSIGSVFNTILRLRQISNHGPRLLSSGAIRAWEAFKKNEVISVGEREECEECEICGTDTRNDIANRGSVCLESCGHIICKNCGSWSQDHGSSTVAQCPLCESQSFALMDHRQQTRKLEFIGDVKPYQPSSKIIALLANLRAFCEERNGSSIKSVIFTSWVKMIDLIEQALNSEKIQFVRIDGGKSDDQRRNALQKFNTDQNCKVLLASIGSAGVGLNLTTACRVHLMEPQWNPMVEEQALDRVCRLGQTREVIAIRYIVRNSIDEYILSLQQKKLDIIQESFASSEQSPSAIKSRFKSFLEFLKKDVV